MSTARDYTIRTIIFTAIATALITTTGWLLTDRLHAEQRLTRVEAAVEEAQRDRQQLHKLLEHMDNKLDILIERNLSQSRISAII